MSTFKKIQRGLATAKRVKASKGKDLFLAQENLGKVKRSKNKLIRSQEEGSNVFENYLRTEKEASNRISVERATFDRLTTAELDWLGQFEPFTDPRTSINELPDDYPALLLPVRLETRFKKITNGATVQHQLWVRIFPDECSIDTFEDIPSEAEIKLMKDYWSILWAAGQSDEEHLQSYIEQKKKAAWKVLAGNLQAGRAYWLTTVFSPNNVADLPTRQSKTETILTILTEEMPSEAEAIKTYWQSVWEAKNDAVKAETAFQILANSAGVGEEHAREIITQYRPINLDAPRPRVTIFFVRASEAERIREAADDEVILTIPLSDDQTIPPEKIALEQYWRMVWNAAADATLIERAFDSLVNSVGSIEKANQLISDFAVSNLDDTPSPTVSVTFVQFPESKSLDTKMGAWSQPAKIMTLPERFVLLGFKGKNEDGSPKQVLNEIGNIIPDPLIAGPNPSVDANELLKAQFLQDYFGAASEEEKKQLLHIAYDRIDSQYKPQEKQVFLDGFVGLDENALKVRLSLTFDQWREDVKAVQYIEYLCQRSETKWLFDFEKAIKMGMGFKVDLEKAVYDRGFDRLFAVGIKLSADAQEGTQHLEELIQHHHFGANDFSILPQGTPTNNTEEEDSGYSEEEDVEVTFERYLGEKVAEEEQDIFLKKDGVWLSDYLGIDAERSSLNRVKYYDHTDQSEAIAMNTALWNATLGYFMENMMTPVFSKSTQVLLRDFYTRYVRGRGVVPTIRIGDQPYGILPVSRRLQTNWLFEENSRLPEFTIFGNTAIGLQQLYSTLNKVRIDFEKLLNQVAFVGKGRAEDDDSTEPLDAHKILLQVLGLHASSVSFDQRYAQSFDHLYNYLVASGAFNNSGFQNALIGFFRNVSFSQKTIAQTEVNATTLNSFNAFWEEGNYKKRGIELLQSLGYTIRKEDVPILEKFFLGGTNEVKKPLIDDRPFSEKNSIRPYATPFAESETPQNYIAWLGHYAINDFDKIKKQEGFIDNVKPNPVLYQMLRQSVLLGYSDVGFQLFQARELLTTNQVKATTIAPSFVGIQAEATYQTRWDYLNRIEPQIAEVPVAQHIATLLQTEEQNAAIHLRTIIRALKQLKDVPTARLERAFVEHLDCCSYRLDAWLLGFHHLQLEAMQERLRFADISQEEQKGIYLGAYGWVENLKPDNETLTPFIVPNDLKPIFDPNGEENISTNDQNGGYIHAPSINQAMTAAVLRNAHMSRANPQDDDTYKVNLSSERVRMALSMIEGMQQGQSLGALLGYQLERGLHDNTTKELDVYIYELRKIFPLRSNNNRQTEVVDDAALDGDQAISKLEARNVVDGLKLVNHVLDSNNRTYPFGFPTGSGARQLKFADGDTTAIISKEVDRLLNIKDAIADLALAEGVHQAVQANYERSASALETYSKGAFPQTPDVIKTPRSGVSLTHRFGIHLKSDLSSPNGSRARRLAEPAIQDFVGTILPDLDKIECKISIVEPSYEEGIVDAVDEKTVTVAQLGLDAIDLLYLVHTESDKNLNALDEYLLKYAYETFTLRPDAHVAIHYTADTATDNYSIFQLTPILRSLRGLLLSARPLKPTDLQLPNEASSDIEVTMTIEKQVVEKVFERFENVLSNYSLDLIDELDGSVDTKFGHYFEGGRISEKIEEIDVNFFEKFDHFLEDYIVRLNELNSFGIPEAGFAYTYDRKAEIYAAIYQKVKEYVHRWEKKESSFDQLINDSLAGGLTEEEQINILRKAERKISTQYTINPSSLTGTGTPTEKYRAFLTTIQLTNFQKKKAIIEKWLTSKHLTFKSLIDSLKRFKDDDDNPTTRYDLLALETAEEERQIVVLAEDVVTHTLKLQETLSQKQSSVQSVLSAYDAEVGQQQRIKLLTQAIKILLGEDFVILPTFNLTAAQQVEINKLEVAQPHLLSYQINEKKADFPLDDWLYGVARVREKLKHWENLVVLSETINDRELALKPLQFPYQEKDTWLALEYGKDYEIESDKLLYTAHFQDFDVNKKQCGLMIDEWTEVIPTRTETTGLTFQYDQPNAEPPQAMLLVTPAEMTGTWSWEDVVGALHETLDLAKIRAIEPDQVEQTAYAQFLPATVATVSRYPFILMSMNYVLDNNLNITSNND
ncbi:MAG: hypothetical protein AAGI23_17150 [Bacteroidota bacterium]